MARGFTILEMTITIGLLLLLVSIGYVFSFTYFKSQQLRTTSDLVASELRRAQTDAFSQVHDASHGIKVFGTHLIRFEGTNYAARTVSEDRQTDFSTSFTVAGQDEFVFSAGGLEPVTAGTLTLSQETLAIDFVISSYGVLTITERAIGG